MDDLNEGNFTMFAIKAYDKPSCLMSEFEDDIKRIKYIKRLLRRYKATGKLKERLIVNHIIILSNLFGVEATTRMLFLKLEKELWSALKPFLLMMNYMPDIVKKINGVDIKSSDISMDLLVIERLRKI